MNANLRNLGYTDAQAAALSTLLETTDATVFAPCAGTAKDAYAPLRLSNAEATVIRTLNRAQ